MESIQSETQWTAGQLQFLEAYAAGRNIFLTGKAGTGKTTVVREAMRRSLEAKERIAACAPTGVAANNLDGQTIHSLFQIDPFGVATWDSCSTKIRGEKRTMWKKIQRLFVDEVSMLRPDVLDAINWTMKKNGCPGLEKKQTVFVGDLKQLKNVLDENERSVLLRSYEETTFLDADIFKRLDVLVIDLDEVKRQSDPEFIEALNLIRDGVPRVPYFNQFIHTEPHGVVIAPHNTTVNEYNAKGLESLPGELISFKAIVDQGMKPEDFKVEPVIEVKNGAKIMYLVNSRTAPLRNGTLGTFVVKEMEGVKQYFIRVGQNLYELKPHIFSKKRYVHDRARDTLNLQDVGSITQYPFRLAYALTIHKCQGLTFDEVTVDIRRKCFEEGQFYTAISRVTGPAGLRILV